MVWSDRKARMRVYSFLALASDHDGLDGGVHSCLAWIALYL